MTELNRKERRKLQKLEAKQKKSEEHVQRTKKKIASRILWIIGVLVVATLAVWAYTSFRSDPHEFDALAKCLSEKNIIMYGAYWCPHCQDQKRMFRDSWEFVKYVECASPGDPYTPTEQCKAAGVASYPTWVFPGGSKVPGAQEFDKLAKISGCPLK